MPRTASRPPPHQTPTRPTCSPHWKSSSGSSWNPHRARLMSSSSVAWSAPSTNACARTARLVPGTGSGLLLLELAVRSGRIRQLLVQRLSILQTTAQELRPGGNAGQRIALLGQQSPEFRVMPTEFLPGAVAVLPDAGTQPYDFRDQHVSIQVHKVFVHVAFPFAGILSRVPRVPTSAITQLAASLSDRHAPLGAPAGSRPRPPL